MALNAIEGEFFRSKRQGLEVVNYAWWLKLDDLVTRVMRRSTDEISEAHQTRSAFGSFGYVEFSKDGFMAQANLGGPLSKLVRVDYSSISPRVVAESVVPTASDELHVVERFGMDPMGRLETDHDADLANDVLVVGGLSPIHVARALSVAALPSAIEHAQAGV